ncbi:MAG: hypothetical protein KZQ64_07180 [gamma proteobacterium symbiont of Bathyaustriella thionipta]|nr:hypothetical protein [gamma proteobacterium symbiont of Bathyaustriella thionipta]MCU7950789.1 hypothetical protein [gamma proteobacterium symbiont of Bathyaustriella thionipta]MCU7953155.1 hypothetical protein [gamma proteobacterium symbiont of Bathyaustriella thionipta]MCU7957304.1 hypothetical protein [gamma proteobacterium symbiont of Bathyaustriella thionipta]MCU7966322.1 hypothetical protein [gamma proteobacterium symbiont of Bathyaustriella thionipta]
MSKIVSEEMLNAYLDNELDEKDIRFIDLQIKNNVQLQKRVEQLHEIKLKIRASYESVSPPVRDKKRQESKKRLIPAGMVASLTLLIGLVSGWYSHSYFNVFSSNPDYLLGVKLGALNPEDNKIMIHLAQNDRVLFDKALTKAEKLLARFESFNQNGKVHVLANSYGMDLLRKDKTPYQERIAKMMKNHENVKFVACKNTIKRLKSNGKSVDLLPGVKVQGPVINEIVSGLRNGWTYMKI